MPLGGLLQIFAENDYMQGLRKAYEQMFDKSFEEALKLADSSDSRDQSGSTSHASNRATKTSETILTNSPSVFILAIGWQSSQARTSQLSS